MVFETDIFKFSWKIRKSLFQLFLSLFFCLFFYYTKKSYFSFNFFNFKSRQKFYQLIANNKWLKNSKCVHYIFAPTLYFRSGSDRLSHIEQKMLISKIFAKKVDSTIFVYLYIFFNQVINFLEKRRINLN